MIPDAMATGGCWPTPTQELLLRAALIDGEEAVVAWQEWHKRTDVENLDHGSSRLLPLLLCNLEKHGVERSRLARYKSVSRYYWTQNQIILEQAHPLLQLLESEGISTLVLQGGALVSLYYPKVSARPLGDFAVLVPTRDATRAFRLLLAKGYRLKQWKSSLVPPERAFSIAHAYRFVWQKDELSKIHSFDIHQHVFQQTFAPDADDAFWEFAVPLELGDVSTRALCGEDSLLYVCAHGVYWDDVPPLRWIADATLILQSRPDLDWNRIVAQTRHHHISIPVSHALKYLQRLDLGVTIPATALREIEQIPTSRASRREWSALTRPRHAHPIALKFWLRTLTYSRWNATNPIWQRPFTFPRYLQFFWGLDSLAQMPSYGTKRFASMMTSKRGES